MDHPAPSSSAARLSTRLAFFIAGFGGASWAPLIPFLKQRCALDDAQLGLLLLCLGAGSIVAMPGAGLLTARVGCRRVIAAATLVICCTLPVLAQSPSLPVLTAALVLFGAGIGTVDCIVNLQAVIVERASGAVLMSGFHGLFSIGGIAGAGSVSVLLSLGSSPLGAACCSVGVILLFMVAALPGLLTERIAQDGPLFALPRGIVLVIGIMCFFVFLTEGAAIDWSAVLLTAKQARVAQAGLGYAAFSAAMTAGRLSGNALVRRLGGTPLVGGGALLAALGMWAVAAAPTWQVSVMAYAAVGAGCSNIVPVLYTAVGRQRRMPEHLAVPAITTLGYSGILAGPAALGWFASATSLPWAIAAVGACLVGVAAAGLKTTAR